MALRPPLICVLLLRLVLVVIKVHPSSECCEHARARNPTRARARSLKYTLHHVCCEHTRAQNPTGGLVLVLALCSNSYLLHDSGDGVVGVTLRLVLVVIKVHPSSECCEHARARNPTRARARSLKYTLHHVCCEHTRAQNPTGGLVLVLALCSNSYLLHDSGDGVVGVTRPRR